ERLDDLACGVAGHGVDVHDADVGSASRLHRGGQRVVVVAPLQGAHRHGDVGVVLVELVDEGLHEGPVAAGEAVPELQVHIGAVVAGRSTVTSGRGVRRGGWVLGHALAAAGGQTDGGADGE